MTWKACYSIPLNRAIKTAGTLFHGEISQFTELKELESLPYLKTRLRLPFIVWAAIIRLKFAGSNKASTEFKNKISAFADKVLADSHTDLLIVSHYFVIILLQKELPERGFRGNTFKTLDFGKVYIFETN